MFVDSARRQLIATGTADPLGYVIDIDRLVQTSVFPVPQPPALGAARAYDGRHQRVFFGKPAVCVSNCPSGPTIVAVPVTGGPVETFTFPSSVERRAVVALAYDDQRDLLFALTFIPGETTLHAIDGRDLGRPPIWSYRVEACFEPVQKETRRAHLGIGTTGDFIYFACAGQGYDETSATKAVVHPVPSGVARVDLGGSEVADHQPTRFSTDFYPFPGSLESGFVFGDQAGDRIGIIVTGLNEKLFVFDARHRAWTGAVVLGDTGLRGAVADPKTGRVYIMDKDKGMVVSDAGALPVSQGHTYPMKDTAPIAHPAFDPLTRRLFVSGAPGLRVFEDRTPSLDPPQVPSADDRTHDIDENLANAVNHTGGASAFGARAILVGGPRSTQVGAIGPTLGAVPSTGGKLAPERGDRGLFLGRVVSAEMTGDQSDGQARAEAVGAAVDDATESDLRGKFGLFFSETGQDPPPELTWDGLRSEVGEMQSSLCADYGTSTDQRASEHAGSLASCTRLKKTAARGWAADAAEESPLQIAHAFSEVETVKVEGKGIRAKATSVARGVHIGMAGVGAIDIGEVRTVGESWAAGRPGTADSSFTVTISNVVLTDAAGKRAEVCSTCDPRTVATEINRRFTHKVQARAGRQDERSLTARSPGGAQALVKKDAYAEWNDINIHGDSLREVSGIQLTLYNDGGEASRLVLQLGAVFTQAIYQIGELKPPVVIEPTKLVVKLIDDVGDDLAGGVFEVRPAEAGDLGVLSDLDAELAGTCITDDDGIGDCTFDDLPPGEYSVTQVTAPTGYAAAEGTTVTLSPGFRTDVVFTNLRAIGTITLSLTDDSEEPTPLPGAGFAVYADNGDLALDETDELYDECTTDDEGACTFDEVPLGAYVVSQTSAPPEHLTADDVGFVLDAPGQAANLTFVTGLTPIPPTPGTPGTPPTEAEELIEEMPADTARVDAPTETTTVIVTSPPMQPAAQVTSEPLPAPQSGVRRLLSLPADTAGYLARRPLQAVLFGLLWALLGAPLYLGLRRRSLILVKAVG